MSVLGLNRTLATTKCRVIRKRGRLKAWNALPFLQPCSEKLSNCFERSAQRDFPLLLSSTSFITIAWLCIWASLVEARVGQRSLNDSSRIIFILEKARLSRDVYESHKVPRATSRNRVFTTWNASTNLCGFQNLGSLHAANDLHSDFTFLGYFCSVKAVPSFRNCSFLFFFLLLMNWLFDIGAYLRSSQFLRTLPCIVSF